MGAQPAVTVVLIVHNTAPWLAECIQSIAAQSFRDFEVVVVDVASNLATKRVLLRYWSSLGNSRFLLKLRNIGGASAGNDGIRAARGTYVFMMDSDDILPVDSLASLHRAAECGNLDVVIGRALSYIGGRPTGMRYSADLITWARPMVTSDLTDHPELTMAPYYWGRLYRRSLLQRHDIRMHPGRVFADRYFTCKSLKFSRRTGVIPELTYLWRRDRGAGLDRPLSITQHTRSLKLLTDRVAGFAETESLFGEDDEPLRRYVRLANLMRLFIHAKHVQGDSGFTRGFVTVAQPYAAGFSLEEVASAPFLLARQKAQWYLTAQGRSDDLAEFLRRRREVAEPRRVGTEAEYDYRTIISDLPLELCAEPLRQLDSVRGRPTVMGGRPAVAITMVAVSGLRFEPLYLVLAGRTPAQDRRLSLTTSASGCADMLAPLPDGVGADHLSSLKLEYVTAGRVCRAPVTVAP